MRTNSQTLIRNAPSLSDDIEFKKEQTKKMQNTERWKTRLSTVWGGNVGLYESALKRIMTTHKQCVKYNLVAPLKS